MAEVVYHLKKINGVMTVQCTSRVCMKDRVCYFDTKEEAIKHRDKTYRDLFFRSHIKGVHGVHGVDLETLTLIFRDYGSDLG